MMSLLMQVSAAAVAAKDTHIVTQRLERWQNEYAENAKRAGISISRLLRGTVIFSIEGYDSDPRELYEIPEVRAWFHVLREKVSSLFYYLDPDPARGQYGLVILMYVGFSKVPGQGFQLNSPELTHFIEAESENVRFFANRIGDNPEEVAIMFWQGVQKAFDL